MRIARRWELLLLVLVGMATSVVAADPNPKSGNTSTATTADSAARPKVLILGDSISIGYTPVVRKNLQEHADVLRPSDNCQHTGHGLAKIKAWLGKEKWDVIHFNWGIWDTHMLDEQGKLLRDETNVQGKMHIRHTPEQYRENLEKLVGILEGTGAKLIWANTTPIMYRTGKRFDDIKTFNSVASDVMQAHGVPVNNLYDAVLPNARAWQSGDRVHFNATGNEQLGKQVSESILKALPKKAGQ